MAKKEETLRRISQEVISGERSAAVIADRLGLDQGTVYNYGKELGYRLHQEKSKTCPIRRRKFPWSGQPKPPKDIRLAKLKEALNKGERSLEELCRLTHLTPSGLRRLSQENQVLLPEELIPYKTRPEIDIRIEKGLTQPKIGAIVGITQEAVSQYIRNSGQQGIYKKAKERRYVTEDTPKNRKKCLRYIDSLLREGLREQAQKEGWAYEKVVEYLSSTTKTLSYTKVPVINALVIALKRYERAEQQGQKQTLEELTEGLPISSGYLSVVLKRIGQDPMHKTRKGVYRRLSPSRKLAVTRSIQVDMPDKDVAYFLDIVPRIVYYHRTVKGKRSRSADHGNRYNSTYRQASQIYEAQDLGFTLEESIELLDIDPQIVSKTVSNRSHLEPRLIEKLRILYDKPDLDKPYKINL